MATAQRLDLWARLKVSLEKAPNPHTGFFILKFMDTLVCSLQAMRLRIFCECS